MRVLSGRLSSAVLDKHRRVLSLRGRSDGRNFWFSHGSPLHPLTPLLAAERRAAVTPVGFRRSDSELARRDRSPMLLHAGAGGVAAIDPHLVFGVEPDVDRRVGSDRHRDAVELIQPDPAVGCVARDV